MKVKLYVCTGFAGCEHIDYVDMPDDTTEDDLNEMARELMMDNIEYGFEIIEEKQKSD